MKPINLTLAGALMMAALTPFSASAQSTPPMDSTTPQADSTATASITTAAPAASPTVSSGATVYGSDGAPVGTIASVAGGNAVVDTGTRKATLALNAFGSGPQGPTITVTKSQLEEAVAKATPRAPAAEEKPAKAKRGKSKAGR